MGSFEGEGFWFGYLVNGEDLGKRFSSCLLEEDRYFIKAFVSIRAENLCVLSFTCCSALFSFCRGRAMGFLLVLVWRGDFVSGMNREPWGSSLAVSANRCLLKRKIRCRDPRALFEMGFFLESSAFVFWFWI